MCADPGLFAGARDFVTAGCWRIGELCHEHAECCAVVVAGMGLGHLHGSTANTHADSAQIFFGGRCSWPAKLIGQHSIFVGEAHECAGTVERMQMAPTAQRPRREGRGEIAGIE